MAPPLAHSLFEPGLRKIGVVADDDLKLRSELSYDIAHELEHGAYSDAVGIFLGQAALIVVLMRTNAH